MKSLLCALLLATAAAADSWVPPDGRPQTPVWPPHSPVLARGIRKLDELGIGPHPMTNVSNPTYVVYQPKKNPSGTCILIFPGGGYLTLAMGLEGTEIAAWLNRAGITAVLLKYRVPYSGCYHDSRLNRHVTPRVPMVLQDAQRTLSIIRSRAAELHINPHKIGVMGFSAGGNLAVLCSTEFKKRRYPALDAIDQVSCRPDFAIPAYPGHLTMRHKNIDSRALNTDVHVSKDVPPTLLVHAEDDPVDPVHYSEVYARALKKVGAPVTLKLYSTGGHAFGVRKHNTDSDRWTLDTLRWLKRIGMLQR